MELKHQKIHNHQKAGFLIVLSLCFLCLSFANKTEIKNRAYIKELLPAQKKTIEYYTNNILNNEYIVPGKSWPFETDPKGEDLFSEYGKPFNEVVKDEEIYGKVTLANKKMTIRSNVYNTTNQQFFIDNILLSIVEKIDYEELIVGKGFWETRDFENTCSFVLTEGKNEYEYANALIDLDAKGYAFFKFDISANPSLKGKIVKYKIKISLTNGRGKRYHVNSDKTYILGCY